MTKNAASVPSVTFIGIECGATRSVAILADERDQCLKRIEAGPANMRLLSHTEIAAHFASISSQLPVPASIGIGMAGVLDDADRHAVCEAANKAWPGIPCFAGNDLETALEASIRPSYSQPAGRIIVISGTGSCCYGRGMAGPPVKVGGWGHMLGDRGSGYDIGLQALKKIIHYYDWHGVWPDLGQRFLRALVLNGPTDLINWVQKASKPEIAALAVAVFDAWVQEDVIAKDVLDQAADTLAGDAVACAKRLAPKGQVVEIALTGSVLIKQPDFAKLVTQRLLTRWPAAQVQPLWREAVWGAVVLARQEWQKNQANVDGSPSPCQFPLEARGQRPEARGQEEERGARSVGKKESFSPATLPQDGKAEIGKAENRNKVQGASFEGVPQSTAISPTEQRNPQSMNLDRLPIREAVQLMLNEDAKIPDSLLREGRQIERAVNIIVRAFRKKGRLFYVGAGTSGRLGVLDASECPPTFRTTPDMVQGIIAGGQQALWSSIEGAEDDLEAGFKAVQFRKVSSKDVVVGIAASGRTPFVWGALRAAKRIGAKTILLCFNPYLEFHQDSAPTLIIAPNVGPEILTGSTRLKAGTATKLVLNILTTLSMVQLGKVMENLMVDLNPSNAKLRNRAVRIVMELTGANALVAQSALEQNGWSVREAVGLLVIPA